MSKKGASYRIVLRNRNGQFTNIRFAQSYEIYYGKRKVISRKPFPALHLKSFTKETTSKKRNYLERTVKTVEKKRLSILEAAKLRRSEKKAVEAKKLAPKKPVPAKPKKKPAPVKPEKKPVPVKPKKVTVGEEAARLYKQGEQELLEAGKDPENFRIFLKHSVYAEIDDADWSKVREEEPITLKNASVSDVLVIPYVPENPEYDKELIEKNISTTEFQEILELSILNFTLKNPIILNLNNFNFVATDIFQLFLPHVVNFFNDIVSIKKEFILRIKFTHTIKDKNNQDKEISQGISKMRHMITNEKNMIKLLHETISKFHGKFDDRGKEVFRNYLAGKKDLYITGFTLEAARRSHG